MLLAATLAPAAAVEPETRPNILFFIFDDWGWRDSGAYGSTWVKTPHFDRLAAEGVRFNHAFTSNPKCSPCRASILTGRNTWQLEEAACHNGVFPKKWPVYPDLLEQAGYAIGLTGKGWGPGDFQAGGWPRNPAGPAFNRFTTDERPTSAMSRNDYVRNFEDFLAQRPRGQPFCFWLGVFEPHRGYEAGSGVRLGKSLAGVEPPPYLPDLEPVRSDLADYAIEVEWGDAILGRVLRALETAGELENTLVVVTSDHGMPFPYVKGQILEDGFRLPLAMRWPKTIRAGRVVEDFVNVADLAPTFLEVAGLRAPPEMSGRSLLPQLQALASGWIDRGRNRMIVAKERHDLGRPFDWGYPVRALRTPEYLYVLNYFPERWPAGNPEADFGNVDPSPTKEVIKAIGGWHYELAFGKRPAEQLFRLADDPWTIRSLAGDPALAATLAGLREQMLRQLQAEGDPRALGNGAIFDTYRYVGGRNKGYETWLAQQAARARAAAELGRATQPGAAR